MSKKIVQVKKLQKKAKFLSVFRVSECHYRVTSGTSTKVYDVRLYTDGASCSCQWGEHKRSYEQACCSHVMAARKSVENASFWANEEDAKRQHRTITDVGDGVLMTTRNEPGFSSTASAESLDKWLAEQESEGMRLFA